MRETEIIGFSRVCELLELESSYFKNDEDTPNERIGWKVKIEGQNDKIKLQELKDAGTIKGESTLSGSQISFVVPIEWGQKTVTFYCYLHSDSENLSPGVTVKIMDHIVAAFYRINKKNPHKKVFTGIFGAEKNYRKIIGPVHHHQGLYLKDGTYYLSGSTSIDVPAYTYMVEDCQDDSFSHMDTILYNKGILNRYRHSGGLQVDKGLHAIGIEKYNYGLLGGFGTLSMNKSVVCFFNLDGKTEYRDLRITRDNDYKKAIDANEQYKAIENDKNNNPIRGIKEDDNQASATGIVYLKQKYVIDTNSGGYKPEDVNKYYVVVRGGDSSVQFYEIDEHKAKIKEIGKRITHVGEFQNVNLFSNERGEIYMFGMGKSKMGGVDTCKIYRVDIDVPALIPVWIDPDGIIKEGTPETDKEERRKLDVESEKNKLIFDCIDETSFHWASCVHIGNSKDGKDLSTQNINKGFEGKLSIHTVNQEIVFYTIDEEAAKNDYANFLEEQGDFYYNIENNDINDSSTSLEKEALIDYTNNAYAVSLEDFKKTGEIPYLSYSTN